MNWLDKLKGKIRRPVGPVALGEDEPRQPHRGDGGTVVRPGGTATPTVAKSRSRFQPGNEITADLQIKNLLGTGGMGEVYLARHRLWDVDVAVKVPSDEIVSDPENRHRIAREAEAWTDLGLHPHIAYCYYAQPLGESLLLVIEYADGGNLRDWIGDGRCADLQTSLDLAIQFCHGLEHAHMKGLVHRDIKPENILLMQDGRLKITDFGIVGRKFANPEKFESPGIGRTIQGGMTVAGIGTADYMAPEQWGDPIGIDLRADIFAFGMCLYEMLCGARAYPMTAGPRQDAPEPGVMLGGQGLPERLGKLMKKCVDWDRDARPAGTQEIVTELCVVYEELFGERCLHADLPPLAALADDLNNRALSYVALGRANDAEKAWQSALEADLRHAESTFNYGLHRWRAGKATDEAVIKSMQASAEGDPEAWLPRYLLVQLCLERGDTAGAKVALESIRGDGGAESEVVAARRALEELSAPSGLLHTFDGLGSGLSACLSADGRYALSAGREGQRHPLKLWEARTGHLLRTIESRTSVDSVALSGDGRFAASAGHIPRGTLELWEVTSGRCLHALEESTNSVCLSADGKFALSGGWDKTLKLWDVESGLCLRKFEGHINPIKSVGLSADGRFAVSGSSEETIKVWDLKSGQCLRTFEGHGGVEISVCLSGDGKLVLSSGLDFKQNTDSVVPTRFRLTLWEVESGRCLRTFEGHNSIVNSVCLSADGRLALSGSNDWTVKLWDLASGRCLRTFEGHSGYVTTIGLSADGTCAVSGSWDSTLKLWKVGSFNYRATFRLGQVVGSAEGVSLAALGETALKGARRAFEANNVLGAYRCLRSVRRDHRLRRGAAVVREWTRLYVRMRRRGLIDCWLQWCAKDAGFVQDSVLILSADGRHALSASWDKTMKLWDLVSGRCLRSFEAFEKGIQDTDETTYSVCLSTNGRLAMSGGLHESLKLWDVESGICLRSFGGDYHEILAICITGDERYALVGSVGILRLWEVTTGRCLRTVGGHERGVYSVCLSVDGRYALSGSGDKTLKLWDVASGRCLRTFEGHAKYVSSACLSADGRYALSGSGDKTLKLWDVESGRCLHTFEGHADAVRSVCLSSDGRFVVSSGGWDKSVKLWEVESGRCLRTLEHANGVMSVSLAPDGQHILSGCADGSVTLWFLEWDLEENEPADWDEGARRYIEAFLRSHQPYGAELPSDRLPTDEEVTCALRRQGRPTWSEEDFTGFLYTLGCAGYGWLRPDGVRRELERMTAEWGEAQ